MIGRRRRISLPSTSRPALGHEDISRSVLVEQWSPNGYVRLIGLLTSDSSSNLRLFDSSRRKGVESPR